MDSDQREIVTIEHLPQKTEIPGLEQRTEILPGNPRANPVEERDASERKIEARAVQDSVRLVRMAPESTRPSLRHSVGAGGQAAIRTQPGKPTSCEVHEPQGTREGDLRQPPLFKEWLGKATPALRPLIPDAGFDKSPSALLAA